MIHHAALFVALACGCSDGVASNVLLKANDSLETIAAKAASVRPTDRQIAWQRDEISAFVHFGMNTFTDREWGDGAEDPRWFNPTELDCSQWVRAAKSAGITRMILTAKHHDGFCLWPTKFTEHCIRNCPWKDGRGDVLGEFVEACRAEGMHFGIYISPWDRHEPSYGDSPRYNEYFLNQLREVLTAYPGASEVWFDGACAEGPNGKRQVYDWRSYWQLIRELAPNATISVRGPDVRWCGNEAGSTRESEWSVIPMPGDDRPWETSDETLSGFTGDIYGDDLGSRDALMRSRRDHPVLGWYPAQVNTSIRPGWFYHASEDDRVRSLPDLLNVYYGSVGGNAQFLLNIPPDRRGLFHENDVARLNQIGSELRATFSQNLAADGNLTVAVEDGEAIGDVATLLDNDPDSFLTTTNLPKSLTLVLDLPHPIRTNCVMLQEHIGSGQRIESFEVESFAKGNWRSLAAGTVVGHKRLLRFPDATLAKLRVRVTGFRVRPTIASLGLYLAPAILTPPEIARDLEGMVTIKSPPGAYVRYTLDGTAPTDTSTSYTEPIPLRQGGLVNATAYRLSPAEDFPDESIVARAEYGVAKALWKVIDCDSQEDMDGQAARAIDDDPKTFWHSRYRERVDPMPHHLAVDLGEDLRISGFIYTPRQDHWDGGIVMEARFEVSDDGSTWTVAADDVAFVNVVNSRQQQVVKLANPVTARFFRVTALRTANNSAMASAAEVSVVAE
jgi:alpha-L-fucosidase